MRRVLAILIFLLGVLITIALERAVSGKAEDTMHAVLEATARSTADSLKRELEGRLLALQRISDRWATRGGTPEQEWRADVQNYLRDYHAFQAIEWIDPSFVVRWVEPESGNRQVIGTDISAEQRRRHALLMAMETRRARLSGPLPLMQGGVGFLAYAPIFRGDAFLGSVIGVFRASDMLEDLDHSLVKDQGAVLAVRHEDAQVYSPRDPVAPGSPSAQADVMIGGTRWVVDVWPSDDMNGVFLGQKNYLILSVGFGLSVLGGLLIWLYDVARERFEESRVREARLGLILDTAPDAIITFNAQGLIESCNPASGRIFGMAISDMIGVHLNRLIIRRSPDGQELPGATVWKDMAETLAAGQGGGVRLFGLRSWMQEFPIEMSVAERAIGPRTLYTAIIRDISGRMKMEAARNRAEAILKAALDTIPEGFVVFDEYDRLVLCNEAYRQLYAVSAEAIRVGASFEEILRLGLSRGQYPQAGTTLDQRLHWMQKRLYQHRNPEGPLLQQGQDGRWLRIEERLTEQGYIVGLRSDITDQIRAEEAIRASEGMLRSLIESSPIGAVLLSASGEVLYANRRIGAIFRMPEDRFAPENPKDLYADPADRAAILRDFADHGQVWDRPLRMVRRDGEVFWALISVSGSTNDLHADRIVWVYDIDDSKRTEMELEASRDLLARQAAELRDLAELNAMERQRAEEATRLKSEFLANVSHEIRTPMTGVLGLTDLLLASPLNDEQAVYASRLKRSGQTLLTLLNDILDFSKIEAGQLNLEQVDFSPGDLIEDVATFLRPKAEEKGLRLTVSIPDPVVVIGDPTRLRQILFNLVGNAIKFTADGDVSVTLQIGDPVPGGDGVPLLPLTLRVRDSGIGIAAERLGAVFEPFRQADSSTTRRYGGTGLGLAICRRLATLMGGEIVVDSVVGVGSAFTLTVPLPVGDAGRVVTAGGGSSALPEPVPGRSYRLLLAEDEETNRMLITIGLQRLGHVVTAVANGREAVAAIEEEDFDLVLLDMHMPLLDGPGVASYIRMLPPPRCSMPVLALTADVLADQRRHYDQVGLDGYLTKPVDWQRMQDAILHWCRNVQPVTDLAPPPPEDGPGAALEAFPTWLAELLDLVGPERILPLMYSARNRLERSVEQVATAYRGQSPEEGRLAAHSLKGIARQFGAQGVGDCAEALELATFSSAEDPALEEGLNRLADAAAMDAVALQGLIARVEQLRASSATEVSKTAE